MRVAFGHKKSSIIFPNLVKLTSYSKRLSYRGYVLVCKAAINYLSARVSRFILAANGQKL